MINFSLIFLTAKIKCKLYIWILICAFMRFLTTSWNNHVPLCTIHGILQSVYVLLSFKHGIITEGSDQEHPREKEV